MLIKRLLIIVSLPIFLTGCDKLEGLTDTYKLSEANGQTFRMNTQTGELAIVKDGTMITLKEFEPAKASVLRNTITANNKVKIEAKTKSSNGSTRYQITVSSAPQTTTSDTGDIKTNIPSINWFMDAIEKGGYNVIWLKLEDADGFEIASQRIDLSKGYTRIVDWDGSYSSLFYSDSFSTSTKVEPDVANLKVTYSLNASE
jgi:hypothetical protein